MKEKLKLERNKAVFALKRWWAVGLLMLAACENQNSFEKLTPAENSTTVPKQELQPMPTVEYKFSDLELNNSREMAILINRYRMKYGLAPLAIDPILNRVAQLKALDMGKNNYFGHENINGVHVARNIAQELGYTGEVFENISAGQNEASQATDALIASAGHRSNILEPGFTHIGTGYYFDSTDQGNVSDIRNNAKNAGPFFSYWAQEFGRSTGKCDWPLIIGADEREFRTGQQITVSLSTGGGNLSEFTLLSTQGGETQVKGWWIVIDLPKEADVFTYTARYNNSCTSETVVKLVR